MTAPEWTRLENSAIIYPSCKTRKYASVFRMSATLNAPVDREGLDEALKTVIVRFPSFRYTVRRGLFWWFMQKLENEPEAGGRRSLGPIDIKANGGYMFRLCSEGCRIDLDVDHALTDGTGAMTFLLSVVAEYLRSHEGVTVSYGKWIYNPSEEAVREEIEDGFDSFSGTKGSLDSEQPAWHVKGKIERPDVLNSLGITFPTEDVHRVAHEADCTVTEYLSAQILYALQQVRSRQAGRKSNFIRMELPVNLRPIFGSKTMRNFASYIYLTLDVSNGDLSLADVIRDVKYQKRLYTQPGRLLRRIAANVKLEDNPGIRIVPLMIKRPIINLVNSLKGDRLATYTFSNLGLVDLPEEMASRVESLDFVLGRQRGRSGACSAVSTREVTSLSLTRRIAEDELERTLLANLRAAGIRATVQVPAHAMHPGSAPVAPRKAVFSNKSLVPAFFLSI